MIIQFCYNQTMEFNPLEFQNWVQEKFADWRGKRRESLAAFSRYIGVSPQVMSNWWNGTLKERPDPKQYGLLVQKYGVEVYDVLGIPRPSEDELLAGLPADLASDVKSLLEELRSSGLNNGKEEASPEDVKKIRLILEKHLGKYQATEH